MAATGTFGVRPGLYPSQWALQMKPLLCQGSVNAHRKNDNSCDGFVLLVGNLGTGKVTSRLRSRSPHATRAASSGSTTEPPNSSGPWSKPATNAASPSLIVTTNLLFERRPRFLGSEGLTGGALDRLTHRCRITETNGESYRLHDAKTQTRRTQAPNSGRQDQHRSGRTDNQRAVVCDDHALSDWTSVCRVDAESPRLYIRVISLWRTSTVLGRRWTRRHRRVLRQRRTTSPP